MAKPELGTKRICPVTGRKFYDLNKDPVISPYTGQIVPIESPATRARGEAHAGVPEEVELAEVPGAEFVSLEEADAETVGAKAVVADVGEDDTDVDLAEDLEDADDTFLEPSEDEDDDVTDIIGGDIEDEEET